jgi:hypothetical protein
MQISKHKRAPQSSEDKILGMVFDRLKNQLKFRYEDMSEWCRSQGKAISVSSLCDMSNGTGIGYLSRIPIVARYFQEVHGLSHVTEGYLLQGSEEETLKVQRRNEIEKSIKEQIVSLPLEEFIEQEAV